MQPTGLRARRIVGFGLNSPDASRLLDFYATAFGARHVGTHYLAEADVEALMGVRGGALRHTMRLGEQAIEVLQFDTPGSPFPSAASPTCTSFQHFAIVVRDMSVAMAQLQRTPGWTAMSTGGPQRLPSQSGGVVAFKFRDPDGHPLEFLEFAEHAFPPQWLNRAGDEIFLGIDHSAISVRNTAASAAFYASLGFRVIAQTLNQGPEQSRLDGLAAPQVEVTALAVPEPTPHLELLCYQSHPAPAIPHSMSNAVVATRIGVAVEGLRRDRILLDPDGHHLHLLPYIDSPAVHSKGN